MRWLMVLIASFLTASVLGGELFQNEAGFPGAVRVEEYVAPDDAGEVGHVIVTIPFLDIHGEQKTGQGKCYFSQQMLQAEQPLPVYVAAHYAIDQERAAQFCEQGFLAVTPYIDNYPLEFVLGDSLNLMKALIQWTRRQPCVDRTRMVIGGGSGGGYMTLAMGSEFFPVAALLSDLPCVNWAYGCNYLKVNAGPSGCLLAAGQERPLPVLALIVPGLPLATDLFGEDMGSDSWFALSPVSYMDRITAPTMMVCATGDMLCTFEQFTSREFYELDGSKFPDGYDRDFDRLTLNEKSRLRFDQAVPKEKLFTTEVTPPAGVIEYRTGDDMKLDRPLRSASESGLIDLPWSKKKQFSFVVLNEGAPLPHLGHTRYGWNITSKSFMDYYINQSIEPEQLNAAKLLRLMERYAGSLSETARLVGGKKANRLNFEKIEQYDVISGLLDYAELGDAHAERLQALYKDCPVKPFGKEISTKHLKELRAGLLD